MGTWTCTSADIVRVAPQGHLPGHMQFGHVFQVDLQLRYAPSAIGLFRDPSLEWNEEIVTFTVNGQAGWQRASALRQNMYAQNPSSNTFFGWRNKYNNASYVVPVIRNAVPVGTSHTQRDQITIGYLKQHATQIPSSILDTPLLGKAAGRTERRIIYFDLGIGEGGNRVTATQVLEVNQGNVTIMKFITPGVPAGSIMATDARLPGWRGDYAAGLFQ